MLFLTIEHKEGVDRFIIPDDVIVQQKGRAVYIKKWDTVIGIFFSNEVLAEELIKEIFARKVSGGVTVKVEDIKILQKEV